MFCNFDDPRVQRVVEGIECLFAENNVQTQHCTLAIREYRQNLTNHAVDLAVIVGGDGTFINVARNLAGSGAPIIGINLGRRGFLTDVSVKAMNEAIQRILDGDYYIQERSLIEAQLFVDDKFVQTSTAMNDVVVHKTNIGRLVEIEINIDGKYMIGLRADGLIIATPTGATAYALSAGGPILSPTLPALELIPISPQSLGNRPIVVNDDSLIELRLIDIESGQAGLIADGHIRYELDGSESIKVRKSPDIVKFVRVEGHSFYDSLRYKLGWGVEITSSSSSS